MMVQGGEDTQKKPAPRRKARRRRAPVVAAHHSRSLRFAALMLGAAGIGLTMTPDEIVRAWDRAE